MTTEVDVSQAIAADKSVALSIRSLRKTFGDQEVLRGIELDVRRGEFLTLLGPSGSGKTTLLRIIAGFDSPTSGSMLLGGRDISRLSPAERELGMVFQQYALFPHMTVADNVAYGLKMRRWSANAAKARVSEMLEIVGLPHLAHRKPAQLSGGQQQRVALARALAYEPALLLMDEPLGALDRGLRLQLEEELRRVHRKLGTTVIYVTHDQEEALVLSDRIAVIEDGRLAGLDAPSSLYQSPPSRFVAKFFANANLIPAVAHDGDAPGEALVEAVGQRFRVDSPVRGEITLAVRPRSLSPERENGDLHLAGRVTESLLLGDERQVKVHVAGIGTVIALVDARRPGDYEPGTPIALSAHRDEVTLLRD